ncbi:MAG: 30S ribosomal protein S9 [Nanoarchaeota archaeon]|nr:30S ribosomal protein S9 [Nanoarchaeota archaeon]
MQTIQAIGKRKTSVARATIKKGTGVIRVNSLKVEALQPEMFRQIIMEPIILAGDKASNVNINVNVFGGGVMSQAQAVRTSIANALVDFLKDKELKDKYLDYDRHMLVADVRQKEMRKPYRSRARARRQKSKR